MMAETAQKHNLERRQSERHPVNFRTSGQHRKMGEIPLCIVNISPHGFMAEGEISLARGERVEIRLPKVGSIEAHLVWSTADRAGFQFERIIRLDDFAAMLKALIASPNLRRV